jgi:C1A family cysteine protease
MRRAVLVLALVANAVLGVVQSEVSPSVRAQFVAFKRDFHRHYGSTEEEQQRLQIFAENIAEIYATNARNLTYTAGITKFADMTLSEYRERYAMTNVGRAGPSPIPPSGRAAMDLPASVDWVAAGVVTPVLDQGQCGSCWIFGTTSSTRSSTRQPCLRACCTMLSAR